MHFTSPLQRLMLQSHSAEQFLFNFRYDEKENWLSKPIYPEGGAVLSLPCPTGVPLHGPNMATVNRMTSLGLHDGENIDTCDGGTLKDNFSITL